MGYGFIYGQNSGSTNEIYYWKVWSAEGMYPEVTNTNSRTIELEQDSNAFRGNSTLGSIDISIRANESSDDNSIYTELTINATINDKEINILDYYGQDGDALNYPICICINKDNTDESIIGKYNSLYFIISNVNIDSSVTVTIISQFYDQNAGFNHDIWSHVETVLNSNISAYPINDYDSNGYYYEFYGTVKPDFTF